MKWLKPCFVLIVLGLLAWFAPESPLDPWHILNIKKIATMIFALSFIQIFGSIAHLILGPRTGAILTGFFGGIVSSTATTASLARRSKLDNGDCHAEMITFLSATGAMLIEGAVLVWMGERNIHSSTLIPFLGPLLITGVLLYFYSRKLTNRHAEFEEIKFKLLPVIKLSAFIISVLLLSKFLQNLFGQSGIMVLTFLVSLFEIHGSVIANVQLHENGVISRNLLSILLTISIMASYLSKLFLISTLGSKQLRSHAIKSTVVLCLSLLMTWLVLSL